jgi:DNA invertase Pin-like site-specific DNA recombinase
VARKSRKPQSETETPKIRLLPTAGYARISLDNGEKSEDSIENQTAIIEDYVRNNGGLEMSGVFTDLGFTGRDFDRPGYAELMESIRRGEVKCLVVKDANCKHGIKILV